MVYKLFLKTSNGILQFLNFDWLTDNGINYELMNIPLTTNIVVDTQQ